jgi:hypothetical protein
MELISGEDTPETARKLHYCDSRELSYIEKDAVRRSSNPEREKRGDVC